MRYVIAGYIIVLGVLFLYAVQLSWRRRRLTRTAARIAASVPDGSTVDAHRVSAPIAATVEHQA